MMPAACAMPKNQSGSRTASTVAPRLSKVRADACQACTVCIIYTVGALSIAWAAEYTCVSHARWPGTGSSARLQVR